jgi:mono/diheme cytochrome c family protein
MFRIIAKRQFLTSLLLLVLLWMGRTRTAHGQFTQNQDTVKVDASRFPARVYKGFRLFKVKCRHCHGLDLSLKTNLPPDRWKTEVKRMQAMPSAHFNDREAQAIVDFLNYDEAHRKPSITAPALGAEPDAVSAGQKVYYAQGCDACHSIGGKGGPMPLDDVGTRLSRDRILRRMQDRRAGAVMPPLPSDTSDQQINQLVDFLLTLKGK